MQVCKSVCHECKLDFEASVQAVNVIERVEFPVCHRCRIEKKVILSAAKVAGEIDYGRSNVTAFYCRAGGT